MYMSRPKACLPISQVVLACLDSKAHRYIYSAAWHKVPAGIADNHIFRGLISLSTLPAPGLWRTAIQDTDKKMNLELKALK
jgi:hypothetical protein